MKKDETTTPKLSPADYDRWDGRTPITLVNCGGIKPDDVLSEDDRDTTKKISKREILKLLKNPSLSNDEKNQLVEELYRDIPIKD